MGIYVGQSKHHSSNVALVYNPRTQLVSPQYHLIYDEGFETVSSANPVAIEKNITALFDNLFKDNEWIHNDNFINPAADENHRYFDFSWDISRIYEDLHARKRVLTEQLAHSIQKNALLRKQLGIPKYLASNMTDLETSLSKGVPSLPPEGAHSGSPTSSPLQASEGVTRGQTWTRSRKRTKKRKLSPASSASEGAWRSIPPASTQQRDTSPTVDTVGTSDDLYNRPPPEDQTESVDPVTPLTTSTDNPPFQADDLLHIISQLCTVTNATDSTAPPGDPSSTTPPSLTGHPLLETLTSLLSTISAKDPTPHVFDDPESSDDELNAICNILDQRNILDEGIDIEGYYDISDPFAFAAGTQNNPDILSRSRMLKAADSADFLKTENDEIAGLHDAGVFQYLPVRDIPLD
jgi:hypothetical protein